MKLDPCEKVLINRGKMLLEAALAHKKGFHNALFAINLVNEAKVMLVVSA